MSLFEVKADDGLRLAGETFGDEARAAVVLLHGGGQTRHAWQGTAEALAAAGFYAVAMDHRGHGDSEWAPAGHYRLDWFASDLRAVARALGRRPHVVGASLGGLAAMLAEGESEARVLESLVLVDVGARLEMAGVGRIIAFMQAHPDGFASLEEAADVVASYLPHRKRPKDLSGLTKNLRLGADGRYRWHWDPRFLEPDPDETEARFTARMSAAARRLKLPTLVVRGRMSDVLSEEAAREMLELVPHAERVDVSNAAHMVAGDANDPFTEAVVGFVGRVARSRSG